MISKSLLNGHKAVWLENDMLRLAVLPEKGADIPLLYHRPSGVQFLMQTPSGLRSPSSDPPADFLENYEGGWQELFPNANEACVVKEKSLPFHGEVALLPWDYQVTGEHELRLSVACRQTPFRLERRMQLVENVLKLESSVTNQGAEEWPFVWGHHLVLGGNFLEDGCRLQMPASAIVTPDTLAEPATARLAEKQSSSWPHAMGRMCGETFDLRVIPGPRARSHDDAFITGFAMGHLDVSNHRLKLRIDLDWNSALYPWVVLWQPYGGADLPPLTGIYGLGIEPWVSRYNLAEAVAAKQAHSLAPGQSITTHWSVKIEQV
jgi:galactose mutarotase-like enzyme